jgi:hypothetical protein
MFRKIVSPKTMIIIVLAALGAAPISTTALARGGGFGGGHIGGAHFGGVHMGGYGGAHVLGGFHGAHEHGEFRHGLGGYAYPAYDCGYPYRTHHRDCY